MEDIKGNDIMTTKICKEGLCTACGACETICPKKCIERVSHTDSIVMEKGDISPLRFIFLEGLSQSYAS